MKTKSILKKFLTLLENVETVSDEDIVKVVSESNSKDDDKYYQLAKSEEFLEIYSDFIRKVDEALKTFISKEEENKEEKENNENENNKNEENDENDENNEEKKENEDED